MCSSPPRNLTLLAPGDGTRGVIAYGLATALAVPAGTTSVEAEVVARMAGSVGNVPSGTLAAVEAPIPIAGVVQPAQLAGGLNPALAYVFVGGVLAISALVLPGVSGAFVLLLLGLYHFVFYSLSQTLSLPGPGIGRRRRNLRRGARHRAADLRACGQAAADPLA